MSVLHYYTRIADYDNGQNNMAVRPKKGVSGGGMNSKALYLSQAIEVTLCNNFDAGEVFLIDPLALYPADKIDQVVETNRIKILWCEEAELASWNHSDRKLVCDNVDVVAVCNEYLQNILREYDIESEILPTPIDSDFYTPGAKKPQLLVVGQASYSKNTDTILKVFSELPKSIKPIFIGCAALWGENARSSDTCLESEIAKVCQHIESASHAEISKLMSESWGYLCMSKYDVGALAMLEAGMSGCECFVWDRHRFADSYPVHHTPSDIYGCVNYIVDQFKSFTATPNYAIRSFIQHRHSYKSFRLQLQRIINDIVAAKSPSKPNIVVS